MKICVSHFKNKISVLSKHEVVLSLNISLIRDIDFVIDEKLVL